MPSAQGSIFIVDEKSEWKSDRVRQIKNQTFYPPIFCDKKKQSDRELRTTPVS